MGGLLGISAPKAQPVVRMPDAKDPAILAAQEQAKRKALASGGRESTNLTGQGPGTYKNETLGS